VIVLLALFACGEPRHTANLLVVVTPEAQEALGEDAWQAEVVVRLTDGFYLDDADQPVQYLSLGGWLCEPTGQPQVFPLHYEDAGCAVASPVELWVAPSSRADLYEPGEEVDGCLCGCGNREVDTYQNDLDEIEHPEPPEGAPYAQGTLWEAAGDGISCDLEARGSDLELVLGG
jgi:hypothetical protein